MNLIQLGALYADNKICACLSYSANTQCTRTPIGVHMHLFETRMHRDERFIMNTILDLVLVYTYVVEGSSVVSESCGKRTL